MRPCTRVVCEPPCVSCITALSAALSPLPLKRGSVIAISTRVVVVLRAALEQRSLDLEFEQRVDLEKCIKGDAAAWDRFVRETAAFVLSTVRRAARRSQEFADDDAQDVFVRLVRDDFRLLRLFDPSRARLSTYLGVIARTVVHERTRRRALPIGAVDAAGVVVDRREDEPARTRAAREHAAALPLEVLSPAQRAVLQLIHEQGLSVEQAAEHLGISAQTVRSAHHKAIARIRAELGIGLPAK